MEDLSVFVALTSGREDSPKYRDLHEADIIEASKELNSSSDGKMQPYSRIELNFLADQGNSQTRIN
jgi:hypothetical protein